MIFAFVWVDVEKDANVDVASNINVESLCGTPDTNSLLPEVFVLIVNRVKNGIQLWKNLLSYSCSLLYLHSYVFGEVPVQRCIVRKTTRHFVSLGHRYNIMKTAVL